MSAFAGGRWRAIRAALLLVVIAVNLFAAAPLPKSVKRSQYDTPMAKEELGRWVDLLAGVGVHATRDELIEVSYTSGAALAAVRRAGIAPFDTIFRVTGTGQGWGLFTYPDSFPHRLTVWARSGKESAWQVLFAGLDPKHDWNADVFTYRRIRGVYDSQTSKPGSSYDAFARWVAERAFADFPNADQVRVGFVRAHITEPGRAEDPETILRHLRTFDRPKSGDHVGPPT